MTQRLASASFTHVGRRERNEDRCGENDAGAHVRAFAVADGVGGHAGGDLAAESAIRGALAAVGANGTDDALDAIARDALAAAQRAVLDAIASGAPDEMASTIVLLVTDGERAAWGHVGDSRLYRVRDGGATALTRDHTLAAAMSALSGSAGDIAHGNQLLSALGAGEPEYTVGGPEPLAPGDAFLLASDGLWSHLSAAEIAAAHAVTETAGAWLAQLAERVQRAGDPSQDNLTAIAVRAD